ncbi:hypothetical protein GQ54DRAFT_299808 [Martensiomyces pterosporus]|nr:hypothetical protein GQ54DRAFT_299808 [Martensiomyces pterosporus]
MTATAMPAKEEAAAATAHQQMSTQHSGIAEDIAESLRALPTGNTFGVRVIHTSDHPVTSLTPRRHYKDLFAANTFSRRILILVSQDDCLVAALEAHEFTSILVEIATNASPPQTTVAVDACIEKVDTSGELSVRVPLVRAIVAGYLVSLRRHQRTLGCPSAGVHLFARSQPEYLFAKSKDNSHKHILGDLALVKWWMKTLHFALAYAVGKCLVSHKCCSNANAAATTVPSLDVDNGQSACLSCRHTAVANCIVPGSAESESPWFHRQDAESSGINAAAAAAAAITSGVTTSSPTTRSYKEHNGQGLHTIDDMAESKLVAPNASVISSSQAPIVSKDKEGSNLLTPDLLAANANVEWKWGLPYPLNARAHDCVLQFPDDPITRLLEAKHSGTWPVSMLLEILSVSEECGSGRRTAYFSASLPLPRNSVKMANSLAAAADPAPNTTAGQSPLSFEDYDKVLIELFDENMDFSTTVQARNSSKRLFDFLDAQFSIQPTAVSTSGKAPVKAMPGPPGAEEPKKHEAPKVNDLTMAIRKKRKVVK